MIWVPYPWGNQSGRDSVWRLCKCSECGEGWLWQDRQPDCLSCWVSDSEKRSQPPSADRHCEGIWWIWQSLPHILKPCRQQSVRFLIVVCHRPLLGWQTTCRINFHSCPVPYFYRQVAIKFTQWSVAKNQHFRSCRKNYALDRRMIDIF